MRCLFRPSHADFTYHEKYGVRDHRGGGRSSARITIARCVGGALAKLALRQLGISITAYTSQVGSIALEKDYHLYDLNTIEDNPVRCPDQQKANEMENLIAQVKADGDTIGGIITCVIKGCPVGLGEPEFDKLHAQLGAAMLGINAVKGFEYGEGFAGVTARGSEQNDVFIPKTDAAEVPEDAANQDVAARITTKSNHSGGIQGGLSNGQDIYFRVAFKPVATLLMEQNTVDLEGNATTLTARGRHDPCVLPRAVPVVEAMAAMVILDNYLLNKTITSTVATELRNIPREEITSYVVYKAAMAGDTLAQEVFRQTGTRIGKACAEIATFLSPEAFIFFGGLTKAGALLMDPIVKSYNDHILNIFKGKAKFLVSGLDGSAAAVLGASAVGWDIV